MKTTSKKSSRKRKLDDGLLEQYLPMIKLIVRSFNPRTHHEREEYLALGQLGLVKAAQKYNPKLGSMSTIAYYCIRTEISNFRRKNRRYPAFEPYDVALAQSKRCRRYELHLDECLPNLTQEEKLVLDLFLRQCTFSEIGRRLGFSRTKTQNIFQEIVRKAKEYNGVGEDDD